MSYGLFNWWWGEDYVVPNIEWKTLSIGYLEDENDKGLIAEISGVRNLGYDNRVYACGDTQKVEKNFGKKEWNGLVESHPDVAKQMQQQPVLIYYNAHYVESILDFALGLTEAEFKKLFVYWEDYEWWILKTPTLNRIVGRSLKRNSPHQYALFAASVIDALAVREALNP
jgi:hypothetical protein